MHVSFLEPCRYMGCSQIYEPPLLIEYMYRYITAPKDLIFKKCHNGTLILVTTHMASSSLHVCEGVWVSKGLRARFV